MVKRPNETQDQRPRARESVTRKPEGGWQIRKTSVAPLLAVRCIAWLDLFMALSETCINCDLHVAIDANRYAVIAALKIALLTRIVMLVRNIELNADA